MRENIMKKSKTVELSEEIEDDEEKGKEKYQEKK